MSSEVLALEVDPVEATENRHCPGETKGKVPKRMHKAEREKMKREQLNELFDELADALDVTQPNNGKASVLCEAARLLKDLGGQIQALKKENASLSSESNYVTIEKNELKEENTALEMLIENLQHELEVRVSNSNLELNEPPLESQQHVHQPAPAVIVLSYHSDQPSHPATASNVSKPHPRYPTPTDLWPSQLLGEQISSITGVHSDGK